MLAADGTENKSKLGANSILGVSLAVARAAALSAKTPLYQYLRKLSGFEVTAGHLPIPMFNVLNGGQHSDSGLAVQEFKLVPSGIAEYHEQLRAGSEIFHALKKILEKDGQATGVGDEGGFAPHLSSHARAFEVILEAISAAGYVPGKDVFLGIDAAASSFYDEKENVYRLDPEGVALTREQLINLYGEWVAKYHLISIEDGLHEEDWEGWKLLNEKLGSKAMLIGDDLLVTNSKRLARAIEEKACNAVLIKVNQIGSLTETLECIALAKKNSYKAVISHRSGETTDDFIADLAAGVGAGYIKTGSLSRGERLAKYNRLLAIESER
jgi:enolase